MLALSVAAAAALLASLLWPLWRSDSNMSHGLFLPVLWAILLFESRREPAPRFLRPGRAGPAAATLLCIGSLACLACSLVYAGALGWNLGIAQFLASASIALLLGALLVGFSDERARLLPCSWPAVCSCLLWLFASEPPPGMFARLAGALQALISGAVVVTLRGIGVAAYREGNVIVLARAAVGVTEACSGVRSLLSCTVAGLFLSAILVRSSRNRVLVVLVSVALALAMNFLRSLALTLAVSRGVDIETGWHDATGASVLAAASIAVAAFAIFLGRREGKAPEGLAPAGASSRSPAFWVVALSMALAAGLCVAAAAARPRLEAAPRAPDLAGLLPAPQGPWKASDNLDMGRFSGILQTSDLAQRTYWRDDAGGTLVSLYIAYWRPGQAAVSVVEGHTPDACWPGSGWDPEASTMPAVAVSAGGRLLPEAQYRRFARNGMHTQVWYWHLYGGHPLPHVDPFSAGRLLALSLRYGFSAPKDQLFIRISSNRNWDELASDPQFMRFFENLRPLGL